MIRLTKHQPAAHETLIRVDGRLDAAGVAEFQRLLAADQPDPTLSIDLTGLTSIDAEGRRFLFDLRHDGCRIVGGSLYIKRLLEEIQP